MSDKNQRESAKEFSKYWADKGYEKGESQPFWLELLGNVFGIENPAHYIKFEEQVRIDNTSFIDGHIPATRVLIEQKGRGKDLRKPIRQSDGALLTPFQQAKRYSTELPYSQRPRWIVTCNFEEFLIYDMERPTGEPESVLLKDLEKEYFRLDFLTDKNNDNIQKEMEVSVKAGNLVGVLYDALLKQYENPDDEESLKSLNQLCVRLVFCLYAEDADIFGRHRLFHDYIRDIPVSGLRRGLVDLFKTLDTPEDKRDKYLSDDNPILAQFPYVNGGLFADENIEIPPFTRELKDLILKNASEDFDWSAISPTIFGAVFESTLNPETRRKGGMHYTSIENIHKVIDPLFLDDLTNELEEIKKIKALKMREVKTEEFRNKLASLTFLDPACGSGNFLTETYISLRRLENEALRMITNGQMFLGLGDVIKVTINQFYGIEINDFACTVAKTALWIAESQMMKETEDIINSNLNFLPLKTYVNIAEGNALKMDWKSIVEKEKLSYIMGNPPFVGYSLQSKAQKEDILSVYVDEKGKPYKAAGKIDYVAGWYFKASELMSDTNIRTAFVSTNSICQGEQTTGVWKPLYDRFNTHIDFAHRTFRWDSEANSKANVHCVIVGFSQNCRTKKLLFDNERVKIAKNINPYLIEAPTVFVESRSTPICNAPRMTTGNRPADGGHLIIEADDYEEFIKKEPLAKKYIKRLVGAEEYINNKKRYCLWLVDCPPNELLKMPYVVKRVEACKNDRLSGAPDRQKLAETPTLFRETKNPSSYILMPRVSSENRRYIPAGFLNEEMIPNDTATIIPGATLYHFGILTSNVHMAWVRSVCGRLKSDYRYSKDIVYNNFPWCNPGDEQIKAIEKTAQAILDARALYSDSSLADLYNEVAMPPELRKAHQENDRAVMRAYGFDVKTVVESECTAELMRMYEDLRSASKAPLA